MVLKFFGFVFVILALTQAEEINESKLQSGATDESKPNEIYLSPGQSCDIKCSNLGDKCVGSEVNPPAGWFCVAGYARKASGKCVKQERCKSKVFINRNIKLIKLKLFFITEPFCPKNEVFLECGQDGASACQETCGNLGQACAVRPISCPRGCFCKKGYARINAQGVTDTTAKCIPKRCCPSNDPLTDKNVCVDSCKKHLKDIPDLCP